MLQSPENHSLNPDISMNGPPLFEERRFITITFSFHLKFIDSLTNNNQKMIQKGYCSDPCLSSKRGGPPSHIVVYFNRLSSVLKAYYDK